MATLKQEEESISEIQNYLDTFNKEIEDPNQIPAGQLANKESVVVNEGDNSETNEDGGTYFVDQSGQYYYQSNDVDVGDGTATLVTPDGGHMVSIPNSTVIIHKVLHSTLCLYLFMKLCVVFPELKRRRSCSNPRRRRLSNSDYTSSRIF